MKNTLKIYFGIPTSFNTETPRTHPKLKPILLMSQYLAKYIPPWGAKSFIIPASSRSRYKEKPVNCKFCSRTTRRNGRSNYFRLQHRIQIAGFWSAFLAISRHTRLRSAPIERLIRPFFSLPSGAHFREEIPTAQPSDGISATSCTRSLFFFPPPGRRYFTARRELLPSSFLIRISVESG